MQLHKGDALILVDVQLDFLPGGSLAVPQGDEVVPALNRYIAVFHGLTFPVVATRDWHPADHCSFAAQGGPWPPHCVAGSDGARLFVGTSNMLAGMRWDIPLYGTMAHSYIQAHDSEQQAFEDFARSHPKATTLLIDTYDTEAAARGLVPLAHRLAGEGIAIGAVRIDSGDLGAHARNVRQVLDAGGLQAVKIFASGNLDEQRVQALLAAEAPIDGFGVGTRMNTSADAPYLDCAYKLQEYDGRARRKRSEGKATWPGRKQVFRRQDGAGAIVGDTLALAGDAQAGAPLLQPVMRDGRRLRPAEPLADIRRRTLAELGRLPVPLRGLAPAGAFPVTVADSLRDLANEVDRRTAPD
ncbi:MAG: isochorismatase family protein [Betaproteobacteria bacterium]|nr:isochorismatase family protein [Betaproteobacteria bacterium]